MAPMERSSDYRDIQDDYIEELKAEVERFREALRIIAEYDGEWVEDDPLAIRDLARQVLSDWAARRAAHAKRLKR